MSLVKEEWRPPESTAHQLSRQSFLTGAAKSALGMATVSGSAAQLDTMPNPSAAYRIPKTWRPVQWLYANLKSADRYDYWMYEHFGQYAAMMKRMVQAGMRDWGAFARSRGLPAVIDEGYFSWPPLNSQFEESAAIRQILELVVETAIEQKY